MVSVFTVTIQNLETITVATVPSGLKVTVDGATYTSPQVFNWLQGSSHTLRAASPQCMGTRYLFARWSDVGGESHSVVTPGASATYTASFTTEYQLNTNVPPSNGDSIAGSPRRTMDTMTPACR
jgi:hypothetical protein